MTTLVWLGCVVMGFALCAPLRYAIRTLLGVRHKTVYPILRARTSQDGVQPLLYATATAQKGDRHGDR